jgi:exosortase A-associated hydrolase 2
MNQFRGNPPALPFFLKGGFGERFCLYYAPHSKMECHSSIIFVHAFADEMNKSRRMAALQARAFAAMGFGVLQMDLFGCGDSSGEFRDARWTIWKEDLAVARTWLKNRVHGPVGLWGLRLGALLALDFAKDSESEFEKIILWQPVISGETFLTQFLRMRMASEMLGEERERVAGTRTLRDSLLTGETLEVAGYELAPALAAAIDSLKMDELAITKCPIHWFEIVSATGRAMPPVAGRMANAWKGSGVELRMHIVPCAPFWATQEISECPALLSATAELFAEALS